MAWSVGGTSQSLGREAATAASGFMATDLNGARSRLRTVEHWLGAAVGLGVGGLVLGCDGPEMPACGGSAAWIAEALSAVADLPRLPRWAPPVSLRVGLEGAAAWWHPPEEGDWGRLRVIYRVAFPGTVIGSQEIDIDLTQPEVFAAAIAPARTFAVAASMEEVMAGRRAGIGAGLVAGEALVAGRDTWLHGAPLRWPDEAVRHKVLDALGDLGTLGIRPTGTLIVHRGGHALHRLLARAASAWITQRRPSEP